MRALLALGAALALAAPALAQNQALPGSEWTTVTTPDGSATVKFPCPADKVVTDRVGREGFKVECLMGTHRFVVVSGLASTASVDGGAVNSFDTLVERAEGGPAKRRLNMGMIGTHRKFTVGCGVDSGGVCMVVVDRGRKAPLGVGYAGDIDGFFNLPEAEQKAANAAIRGFVQSLEMHD